MPSLTNSVRPAIRTATAAPPGSFGHVANSRAMIFSTLLSATGEPAGAEEAIRAAINAADASRIILVRLIVTVAAGGGADIVARLIGQWLSERLGQPFIIENRPGGGGNIGTEAVVRAPADGYTLLLCGPMNATNATLYD